MRRKSLSNMENHGVSPNNGLPQSQFLTRLVRIPVISSALGYASEFYGKAKNSGGFVGKTLGVAESVASAAAGRALPLVPSFAVERLVKVDSLATFGLEKLEKNVPAINKKPEQLVSETKELISARVSPVTKRFNHYSHLVLRSQMLKVTFDLYENVLVTMSHTLDMVLPPPKNGDGSKPEANGFLCDGEKAPEDGGARMGFLLRKTALFFATATKRVFGIAQSRVDSAKNATNHVVDSAKESIQKIMPAGGERNGEAKQKKSKKAQ